MENTIQKSAIQLFQFAHYFNAATIANNGFDINDASSFIELISKFYRKNRDKYELVELGKIVSYSHDHNAEWDPNEVQTWWMRVTEELKHAIPINDTTVVFKAWADTIHLYINGFSISSTISTITGLPVPCLSTKENAEKQVNEECDRYRLEIEMEERDPDDEYEGCVEEIEILANGQLRLAVTGTCQTAAFTIGYQEKDVSISEIISIRSHNID